LNSGIDGDEAKVDLAAYQTSDIINACAGFDYGDIRAWHPRFDRFRHGHRDGVMA
jgi:hypothetical protein